MQPDLPLPDALETVLRWCASCVQSDRAALLTFDIDGGLDQALALPESSRLWEDLTAQNIDNFVTYTRRALIIPDLRADERWVSESAPLDGSAVCVPILYREHLWGLLLLLAPETEHFSPERVHFLNEAASTVASSLENWAIYARAKTTEANTRRLYEKAQAATVEHTRTEQMRRDLTAMIYHDLRNPLQSITASLSGLSRVLVPNDNPMADELMRLALQSLRRVSRMVKSLLDLERLEEGQAILARKNTKLHNLLSDAVELVYPLAREAEQTLALELDDNLPMLVVDPDMILRVLTNLVENAIKHTPTGGKITVRAQIRDSAVQISVIDTGPGVPSHFRQEIFDKYFRIKYVNAPNGVGLGLAFCRLAIEAHGGDIWVDSDDDGGAVFAFTLPLIVENAIPA